LDVGWSNKSKGDVANYELWLVMKNKGVGDDAWNNLDGSWNGN
jgi:hypothetical protein